MRYIDSMEIGTTYNFKGQGGVQSHATKNGRTLCGRTPSLPNWDVVEPGTLVRLANVSCNRCREAMGTFVETAEIDAAVQRFLDKQEVHQ